GQDLAFDTVLQRGDDRAAVGIVFGVGGKHEQHIQRHAQFETPDLDIAFFQDIEKRHLYPRLQIGDLVDDEDAAVAFWDDTEMDHLFIGEGEPQIGSLDWIDVSDEVGYADVRRRQLFSIPLAAMQPADRG